MKKVLALLLCTSMLALSACSSSGSEGSATSGSDATTSSASSVSQSQSANTSTSSSQSTESSDDVTMGEKNALESAKSYLDVSPFSHSGLIQQLEFEGYTTEEATYAADNCGADWNEQAA